MQFDRRVLSANELMNQLAPRVTIGALNRLRVSGASADDLLQSALSALHPNGVRSIPVPATHEHPALIVHVVPIRREAHDVFVRGDVLLLVTPVTAPMAPLTEVLTGLFDLTPAEARIARGLSVGQTVEELSTAAGVSRETVRTQLKSLMAKTGTSRQVELALLLSGITLR